MANGTDRPPAFQFYPREYLSSQAVAAMHPTARGGYVHLLCHAWLSDRPGILPNDEKLLASLSGLGERWPEHRDSIARAWCITDAHWMQTRLVKTRREQKKFRKDASGGGTATAEALTPEQRSEKARCAANARWNANRMLTDANTASASASASAKNQKKRPRSIEIVLIGEKHISEAVALYGLPEATVRQLAAKIAVAHDKSGKPYRNHPQALHTWCKREPKPTPVRRSTIWSQEAK